MGIQERKEREFARREEEILDAALHLLDCDDWLSVTVEKIANEAEIGKGTIYKHFPSKNALYAKLTLSFYGGLMSSFQQVSSDLPADEAFRHTATLALRYHLEHPQYRRVVQYCNRGDFKNSATPELLEQFHQVDDQFDRFGDELVQRGIDQGLFANRPIEEMKYGIHACFDGAINTLWEGYCWGRDIDNDRFIDATVEFMLAGLRHVDQ
ncbi:hypothetical protein BOW53_03650 [Solemya pervernicosa gill symbiont]|uniref:HTH tetR-type domain-containing protein n=2 Tax=Gammaproteobacteria incertae sedis TaxID=118884 RepID=A0A1T2L8Q2_9GAMM|nr:TetR/AcrR family transcriptional regulator [Candidatus Reidiella endopervernicosa]OOZ41479.1 hypothetical protein BOW53_03650 [Solemya pervernicosa gill symbiont]QKQ27323.1 TetR/AcrR family transcriptional regulator [Candidatus Reidiella endopervernicosa]